MRNRSDIRRPARFPGMARVVRAAARSKARLVAVLAGGMAVVVLASAVPRHDGSYDDEQTRLSAFTQAAPGTLSLIDRWFRRNTERPVDAVLLIPDEVREQFFEAMPYGPIIREKSEKYGLDPILVAAIVEVESEFVRDARSPKGALGLMQLRPATGRWMGAKNLLDPIENIEAGTRYLKYLEGRFEGDLNRQLAAYNAGEGTVMRYGGIPPYPETIRYVRKVRRKYERWNRDLEIYSRQWVDRFPQPASRVGP